MTPPLESTGRSWAWPALWSGASRWPSPWPASSPPRLAAPFPLIPRICGPAPGSCYLVADGLLGYIISAGITAADADLLFAVAPGRCGSSGAAHLLDRRRTRMSLSDDGRACWAVIEQGHDPAGRGSSFRPTDGTASSRSASRWLCSPGAGSSEQTNSHRACVGAILWEREGPPNSDRSRTAVPASAEHRTACLYVGCGVPVQHRPGPQRTACCPTR